MMKTIYLAAWLLLVIAAVTSILTGTLNPATLVVFSLIALGLVYALALWLVTANTRDTQPE